MHVDTGMQILDVGCGPGIDTIPLSDEVGITGRVVGVDVDEDLLAHAEVYARETGVAANVVHQRGDVSALACPAETFDACRAERLFQVLPSTLDPVLALTEM